MRAALLSPEGVAATENLRKRFAGGKEMIATDRAEYEGYGFLLSDFWGFELEQEEDAIETAESTEIVIEATPTEKSPDASTKPAVKK